jgi:hypothetical protein
MSKPRIEVLPIEQGATPDPNNVNKHTQRGGKLLGNSLRKRGAFRSIASAGKGVSVPVVGAGNFTLENAVDAGFTEVVNIHVIGNQLVNVVRDDIEPGSPEFYALAIEDNEIGKQSYNPDVDILAALTAGDTAILAALKQDDKIFAGMLEGMGGGQVIKTLEELEAEYGGSNEDDFHPVIKIKVTPEIKERFDAVMTLMPGINEMEKLDALISRGELS